MDERVRQLLDRVRDSAATMSEAAGSTARCAARYAGETVNMAKLNMKIFDLKTDINALLREIGQLVYDAHQGKDGGGEIEGLLRQIDEKRAAILEVKGRLAALKRVRTCPGCGEACAQEDKFCKSCGKPL